MPEHLAVSVVTAGELELGVLRAADPKDRAVRLATLSHGYRPPTPCYPSTPRSRAASRGSPHEPSKGRRLRRHDTWIAATAMRHEAAVLTQDTDFSSFGDVDVIRA